MHAKTPSQGAPARRVSVLMRYWVPHRSHAVRVGCAHLQAENDALYDQLQQRHDHAAEAPPHKCELPSAHSTATLSSQALCEDESVTATPRGAPIFTVDFGRSDPPSPLFSSSGGNTMGNTVSSTVSGIGEKMPQHDFISRHMTGDPGGACTDYYCMYILYRVYAFPTLRYERSMPKVRVCVETCV